MRRLVPRMFHRRLLLIAAAEAIALAVLGARMVVLARDESAAQLTRAEAALESRQLLPTWRGSIRDAAGRVLAQDRAVRALSIRYEVIEGEDGEWVRRGAEYAARHDAGASRWGELEPEARRRLVEERIPEWQAWRREVLAQAATLAGLEPAELDARLAEIHARISTLGDYLRARQRYPGPIRAEREAHEIAHPLDDDVAFAAREAAEAWRARIRARLGERFGDRVPAPLEVDDLRVREYPNAEATVVLERRGLPAPLRRTEPLVLELAGVADHLVGRMRATDDRDVGARPLEDPDTGALDLGGYAGANDTIGAWGLEAAQEATLRGRRGQLVRRRGLVLEEIRDAPQPGRDLDLTIDLALQAAVQGVMDPRFGLARVHAWHPLPELAAGDPLDGAAVVIEIATGAIRALVSTPTIASGASLPPEERERRAVAVNRPVEQIAPPGSIVKPLLLVAAHAENVLRLDEQVECTGHYFPDIEHAFRCWIYREHYGFATHGALGPEEAIARSCNMYFYTLADRLGADRLVAWYRRFGAGAPLEIGLRRTVELTRGDEENRTTFRAMVGELGGRLPAAERCDRKQCVAMGIGQQFEWTPLHAADALATLARGGVRLGPFLLTDEMASAGSGEQLPIRAEACRVALRGLHDAIAEPYGTGHALRYDPPYGPEGIEREPAFDVPGVFIWGKTGTAEVGARDLDGDGVRTEVDHAWFVGLVGPDRGAGSRPTHAIAVFLEHGGSGGRTSTPIAAQIARELVRLDMLRPAPGAGAG